ncbi:MAG: lipoate--protein ligase [Lachnospiraceae bacterium]|nr:lipoate--protein ligase [Lachnospiraceae bacterium]
MEQSFTCLETGSTDPYYNLAFEEYVLTHRREGSYLILWQNENTIVIGLNQNTEAEINRALVEEKKIRVVRRTTGGGAVYHDLGNLNYSFITDTDQAEAVTKERFTEPILAALRSLGVQAEASGRNDILAEGRKVSGTAQRIDHGRILHHGTLLFDSDPAAVEGALRVDPEKFKAKGIQSVRSRIGNIRPLLKTDMTMAEFRSYLLKYLTGGSSAGTASIGGTPVGDTSVGSTPAEGTSVGCVPSIGTLTEEELRAVRELRDRKYVTWEWNYGRSPALDMHFKKRFPAGTVEVLLSLSHGVIQDVQIFGDFLALTPVTPLLDALRGTPFRKEPVSDAVRSVGAAQFDQCLGGITEKEFLSLLFE